MTSILERRQNIHRRLEQHRRQYELLEKQIELLESAASVGSATAMIAHEINNILTPIGNYAELALRNIDDKKLVEKALKRSRDNCKKAAKVVEAVLNISNGTSRSKEKVCLAELVDEVFDCLCRDFNKDGITLKIQIDKSLTVFAEKVKLQQVFMNLILNARQAMLKTGGTLTICAERQDDFINIEVCDTGSGIKPENISMIFNPFFTTKTGGTGLGLAFCKKVTEQHGGTISVESNSAQGSVFKIKLPDRH